MTSTTDRLAEGVRNLAEPVVVIGSVSFEPRCLGVARSLVKAGFPADQVHLIDYELDYPTTSLTQGARMNEMRQARRSKQAKLRTSAVDLLGQDSLSKLTIIKDPLTEMVDLVRNLAQDWEETIESAGTVILDVTTMAKPLFFPLSRLLRDSFQIGELAFANAVPGRYSQRLTHEIGGLGIVPGFNGETRMDRPNALVAVLGFDGDKLEKIVEEWDFEILVPVVGFPAFHPGLQDRTIWENARVLRERSTDNRVTYCPSLDIPAAVAKLREVHARLAPDYNVWFAPLGPKPMAVAVAEVARATNSRVVMAYPQAYDPDYSSDCSEIYLWRIED